MKFGQYRAEDAINPMVNAWAIVNNLRPFLPDAKKGGGSLWQNILEFSSKVCLGWKPLTYAP
ncbi:hypothetical protein HRE53_28095 (plasmid) [Acaryochloris sp. 'Moss Beach']|uniref:hypothetical protein n=1 Tax=Acaryochloris sp. 'Moss Beach' TaxID=2740837 RepID=UPI001F38B4D0|nr:hypothetical protein [Acaryochloris sp. 'Moss Beach']UJB72675.1 hypothetical protein HRE53_28095 [Acaryochloris sp. 'Moss Beach']